MLRYETDTFECRKLWDMFSPQQQAWDDWDLMFAFHDQDRHRLNFLVHMSSDGQADGLLPLVFDSKQNRYMLMAGSYPDGRVLWLRKQDFPEFFEQLPERTVLFDLKQSWVNELLQLHPQFEVNFSEQDLRYYLVPSEFDLISTITSTLFPPRRNKSFFMTCAISASASRCFAGVTITRPIFSSNS